MDEIEREPIVEPTFWERVKEYIDGPVEEEELIVTRLLHYRMWTAYPAVVILDGKRVFVPKGSVFEYPANEYDSRYENTLR